MLDSNLNNLRKYEFKILLKSLKIELFENILEIGPGDTPVSKFKNIKSYIGVEKYFKNDKNKIYLIDEVNDYLDFDIDLVIALNSIYFLDDIIKFYSKFENFNPKYFIYVIPTPTWRIWTSLSAYLAFFLNKNIAREGRVDVVNFLDMFFLKRHGIRGNRFNEFLYYRKKYWSDIFSEVHKGYFLDTKKIGIFYTGFSLMGDTLSITIRKVLSKILGSSSRIYILSRVD
jgi:hypothetical protein